MRLTMVSTHLFIRIVSDHCDKWWIHHQLLRGRITNLISDRTYAAAAAITAAPYPATMKSHASSTSSASIACTTTVSQLSRKFWTIEGFSSHRHLTSLTWFSQPALSSAAPKCLISKAATSKLLMIQKSKCNKSLIRLSSAGSIVVIIANHLEDMCNTKYKKIRWLDNQILSIFRFLHLLLRLESF